MCNTNVSVNITSTSTMPRHLPLGLKLSFVFILCFVFLFFFGYPALTKYRQGSVFIEISSEPNNVDIIQEIAAPTITFCALNSDAGWSLGWNNSNW